MISKRLKAVADMVTPGLTAADIGTDHAYVPIYLIEHEISPKVYAMDINEGPIRMAIANVENEGYEEQIVVAQANGMQKLEAGQVESVVIAGMGGELIVQILKDSKVNDSVQEFILSPHKNPEILRKYLNENGYLISEEQMLQDGGKYYVIMKVVHGEEPQFSEEELLFGRKLMEQKDEVLKEYLTLRKEKFEQILDRARKNDSADVEVIQKTVDQIAGVLGKL
ncbi:MAG: class I SAM-dependent methyltransferase [Eubacterium sp.]|nr:class I SAM-dependent methyltransferase [Eubacterium sp.]